jgi:hypothetical protein
VIQEELPTEALDEWVVDHLRVPCPWNALVRPPPEKDRDFTESPVGRVGHGEADLRMEHPAFDERGTSAPDSQVEKKR